MDMPCTCPDSRSTGSMSNMPVVFFTSTTTPIYSISWSPSSTGWYAVTCIFLIIFAAGFKFLRVYRARQEHRWKEDESRRQFLIRGIGDNGYYGEEAKTEEGPKIEEDSSIWIKIKITVLDKALYKPPSSRPWRISEDVPRACLDVVVAGVGYLL